MMAKYSDTVIVLPTPFAGGTEAARAMERGESHIAPMLLDTLAAAVERTGAFSEYPLERLDEWRILFSTGKTAYVFLARAEIADKIKSWRDFVGYKVWLGAPATTYYEGGLNTMKALGIYDDITDQAYDYETISDAIQTGDVDVIMSPVPGSVDWSPWFIELETVNHMIVIPPTDEELDAITKVRPVVGKGVADLPTTTLVHDIGVKSVPAFMTYNSFATISGMLPEDVAYEFMKVVYEHAEEMAAGGSVAAMGSLKLNEDDHIAVCRIVNGLGFPIHPGVAKYFKEEKGMDLEALGILVKE